MLAAAQIGNRSSWRFRALGMLALLAPVGCAVPLSVVKEAGWQPEQQALAIRDDSALPPAPIPKIPPPVTVSDQNPSRKDRPLSLNEAVRITLENAKAVRVFTGVGATNSGRTIYDAAIANTAIDQQQARFDPAATAELSQNEINLPRLGPVITNPLGVGIVGSRGDNTHGAFGISKVNTLGGRLGLNVVDDITRQNGSGGLNPADTRALELNFSQPLLRGGGFQVNTAPIVLARLDTERSYFQFKDATQELVRGTIEAYWNLVLARLQLLASEIQYTTAKESFDLAKGKFEANIKNRSDLAQATVTLNQFDASRIAAQADVYTREAALRNVIGLPPSDGFQLIPTSTLTTEQFRPDWDKLLRFAEQHRPDLIELKLILEADAQRRIQAANSALPQLDANALYRWNGLSGKLPATGTRLSSDFGQFNDWSVGATFSVPLGLREGRARVREQDLIILRDRANLEQGLHAAGHDLATVVRALASSYKQYLAYSEMRAAAEFNRDYQWDNWRKGVGIYLNYLQAVNDWGAAVSSQARALADYNVLLASLERQTGTILETHGLVFLEERFEAVGPLAHVDHMREFSRDLKPTGEPTQFPDSGQPGEKKFDLKRPEDAREPLPVPKPAPEPKAAAEEPEIKFAGDRANEPVGPSARLGRPGG
jgi:outer membrane protein TolC